MTQELVRQFKFNATTLPDPDPSLDPDAVRKLYAVNYPALAAASVSEPVVDGGYLTYIFEPPVVKTKG
jgi:PRTRC genetic system protein C